MTPQVLYSTIQPFDGKNRISGIYISGETAQGFSFALIGNNASKKWWFLKYTKPDMSDQIDMTPDEVIPILNQVIQQNPDEEKTLVEIRMGYSYHTTMDRNDVKQLLSNSVINRSAPITRVTKQVDETGDEIYTGAMQGPLYYQLTFSKNGTQTFKKSAHKDMAGSKNCTPEEALFILHTSIFYDPTHTVALEKLIEKINRANPKKTPSIKVLRYNGLLPVDKKDLKKGYTVSGEINGFYFTGYMKKPNKIQFFKSKTRNMRGAVELNNEEILTLLPQLIDKEKTEGNKKYLTYFLDQQSLYAAEPVNIELMTTDFTGKTDISSNLCEEVDEKNNALQYTAFLKGHIFCQLYFEPYNLKSQKATMPDMADAVPCTRDEVRFILGRYKAKYALPQYQTLLDWAEKIWQQQDVEIKKELDKNPNSFLTDHESLMAFDNINPVIYQDAQQKSHLTAYHQNKIYHVILDEEAPVFATFDGDWRPMEALELFDILNSIDESQTDLIILAEKLPTMYATVQKANLPEIFNSESILKEDANRLRSSLPQDAVQKMYVKGKYPQLTQPHFSNTFEKRVATSKNPCFQALYARLRAGKEMV